MSKELKIYCEFYDLNYTNTHQKETFDFNSSESIQEKTRMFITNLNNEFESTVNTIFRTLAKIDTGVLDGSKMDDCLLCKRCF